MKRVACIICLLFGISSFLHGQDNGNDIISVGKFNEYSVPDDPLTLHTYANSVDKEWTVFLLRDSVMALNTAQPKDRQRLPGDSIPENIVNSIWREYKKHYFKGRREMRIDDGYIIGLNYPEQGTLLWYSKDGNQKCEIGDKEELIGGVVQVIRRHDSVFVLENIVRKTGDEAVLYYVYNSMGKWKQKALVSVKGQSQGIAVNGNNNFVIATLDALYEINGNDVKPLIENAFWGYKEILYPHSLVIHNDELFLGMRKGIFRMNLTTGKKDWLMKD